MTALGDYGWALADERAAEVRRLTEVNTQQAAQIEELKRKLGSVTVQLNTELDHCVEWTVVAYKLNQEIAKLKEQLDKPLLLVHNEEHEELSSSGNRIVCAYGACDHSHHAPESH